jgi:hypothetical protein
MSNGSIAAPVTGRTSRSTASSTGLHHIRPRRAAGKVERQNRDNAVPRDLPIGNLVVPLASVIGMTPSHMAVIPGRRTAASPESMNTGLWNMDSGLGLLGLPGMTS